MLFLGCGRSPCPDPGQVCRLDAPQRRIRPPRSRPHTLVFTAHGPCQPPCSALSQGTRWPGPKSKAKRRTRPALKTLRALAECPECVRPRCRARLPSYSFASLSHKQAGSRTRCARREAPPQSRLGALLPLSLVGTRSCFCRDRLSQRLDASFSLRRLGGGSSRLSCPRAAAPTCAGLRERSCPCSGALGNLLACNTRAGCQRSPDNSPR